MPDQCTAFLVEPDLVLTNRHCLPASARAAGASCAGARLYFPATGPASTDSAACRTVVALSEGCDRIDQPDWALVRLDRKLPRRAIAIDRSGVQDLDTLKAWVAEPDWTSIATRARPAAEIRSVDCLASRRTRVFRPSEAGPDFSDPLSRKVPLASCPTWKGNSGSPGLARRPDGSWAAKVLLDRAAPTSALRDAVRAGALPLLDTALGDFAFATNLACVAWTENVKTPAACRADSSPGSLDRIRRREREEVDSAIRQRVRSADGPRTEGRILQAGVWPPFPRVAGAKRPAIDALVVPLPGCGPVPDDSSWTVELLSIRFGYDRNLRWTFRMDGEDRDFRVRSRCRGPESARICQFEGAFPGGPELLRTDTLPRCPQRLAGSRPSDR